MTVIDELTDLPEKILVFSKFNMTRNQSTGDESANSNAEKLPKAGSTADMSSRKSFNFIFLSHNFLDCGDF